MLTDFLVLPDKATDFNPTFTPSQFIKSTDMDNAYDAQHATLKASQEEVERLKHDAISMKMCDLCKENAMTIMANERAETADARVKELEEDLIRMTKARDRDFEQAWMNGASAQRYRADLNAVKLLEPIEDCGEHYHGSCDCTEEYYGRVVGIVDLALKVDTEDSKGKP